MVGRGRKEETGEGWREGVGRKGRDDERERHSMEKERVREGRTNSSHIVTMKNTCTWNRGYSVHLSLTLQQSHLQVLGHGRRLYGHTAAIVALYVCKPFSIMVSASLDHTCIIWDINR